MFPMSAMNDTGDSWASDFINDLFGRKCDRSFATESEPSECILKRTKLKFIANMSRQKDTPIAFEEENIEVLPSSDISVVDLKSSTLSCPEERAVLDDILRSTVLHENTEIYEELVKVDAEFYIDSLFHSCANISIPECKKRLPWDYLNLEITEENIVRICSAEYFKEVLNGNFQSSVKHFAESENLDSVPIFESKESQTYELKVNYVITLILHAFKFSKIFIILFFIALYYAFAISFSLIDTFCNLGMLIIDAVAKRGDSDRIRHSHQMEKDDSKNELKGLVVEAVLLADSQSESDDISCSGEDMSHVDDLNTSKINLEVGLEYQDEAKCDLKISFSDQFYMQPISKAVKIHKTASVDHLRPRIQLNHIRVKRGSLPFNINNFSSSGDHSLAVYHRKISKDDDLKFADDSHKSIDCVDVLTQDEVSYHTTCDLGSSEFLEAQLLDFDLNEELGTRLLMTSDFDLIGKLETEREIFRDIKAGFKTKAVEGNVLGEKSFAEGSNCHEGTSSKHESLTSLDTSLDVNYSFNSIMRRSSLSDLIDLTLKATDAVNVDRSLSLNNLSACKNAFPTMSTPFDYRTHSTTVHETPFSQNLSGLHMESLSLEISNDTSFNGQWSNSATSSNILKLEAPSTTVKGLFAEKENYRNFHLNPAASCSSWKGDCTFSMKDSDISWIRQSGENGTASASQFSSVKVNLPSSSRKKSDLRQRLSMVFKNWKPVDFFKGNFPVSPSRRKYKRCQE